MLFEGDQALHSLLPEELERLAARNEIDFPSVTEREIQDKSKGDMLSKGLVVVQTGWFVLECIARGIEHLSITELELVTLSFATLNLVTYGLWWNKPLHVQCPIPIAKKPVSQRNYQGSEDEGGGEGDEDSVWDVFERAARGAITVIPGLSAATIRAMQGVICKLPGAPRQLTCAIFGALRHAIQCTMGYIRSNGVWGTFGRGFSTVFEYGFVRPFIVFCKMGVGEEMWPEAKRVPSFYPGKLTMSDGWLGGLVGSVVATVFGAIHCIAWSFPFPSHMQQMLWRISSLYITCTPVFPWAVGLILSSKVGLMSWVEAFLIVSVIVCSILYLFARVTLLVLAFLTLRSLPADAYQTVYWTTFIPHI